MVFPSKWHYIECNLRFWTCMQMGSSAFKLISRLVFKLLDKVKIRYQFEPIAGHLR